MKIYTEWINIAVRVRILIEISLKYCHDNDVMSLDYKVIHAMLPIPIELFVFCLKTSVS